MPHDDRQAGAHKHRRHHRHSREGGGRSADASSSHGLSRHQRAQERALESRIQDALNPDRDAVEAKRAAKRLERRIARALRSEGYGSPLKELRARRKERHSQSHADRPAEAHSQVVRVAATAS